MSVTDPDSLHINCSAFSQLSLVNKVQTVTVYTKALIYWEFTSRYMQFLRPKRGIFVEAFIYRMTF